MGIQKIAATVLVVATVSATASADSHREAFTARWLGKTVLLKQVLYTLRYDERGLLGQTRRDKRDGLNVVTPFEGSYFQFDGRQKQDDVVDLDAQLLVDKIQAAYQADILSVRPYQKIQPHILHRYDFGVELRVSRIRIERDYVRLVLEDPRVDFGDEPATTLTVRWPVPFSRSFEERNAVEGLILQYLYLRSGS